MEPREGFQRVVNQERARAIAVAVLDQKRTFPNAIVLASDIKLPGLSGGNIALSDKTKFLIVDGQHRLFSQHFSDFDAPFMCVIHLGLTEMEMARLFLEINDNQKRVPSSLRWDLFRLTRPDDDPVGVRTSDLVFDLASDGKSSLYQRVDLTGEQPGISLKQGSVAPAVKSLISGRSILSELGYDLQLKLLIDYVAAMRECDTTAWDNGTSPLYGARVFRAVFRLFNDIEQESSLSIEKFNAAEFYDYLKLIDLESLSPEKIKASQGTAGIKAIYDTLLAQVIG